MILLFYLSLTVIIFFVLWCIIRGGSMNKDCMGEDYVQEKVLAQQTTNNR